MTLIKKYQIEGMDCTSCAKMVELDLEDLGINAKCSYDTGRLEAELKNPGQEAVLKNAVAELGYKLS